MNCRNCGRNLDDDFKFCPICATPVLEEQNDKIILENNTNEEYVANVQDSIDKDEEIINEEKVIQAEQEVLSDEKAIEIKPKNKLKRIFLLTMIISLSISALLGIGAIIFGDFGEITFRILSSTMSIGAYSLLALCCSTIFSKPKLKYFSLFGMSFCILSLFYALFMIWEQIELLSIYEFIFKLAFATILVSIVLAQVSLLLLIKPKNKKVKISLYTTLSLAGVFLLVTLGLIYEVINLDNDTSGKLYIILIILDVLGTILTPIIAKITDK